MIELINVLSQLPLSVLLSILGLIIIVGIFSLFTLFSGSDWF